MIADDVSAYKLCKPLKERYQKESSLNNRESLLIVYDLTDMVNSMNIIIERQQKEMN